MHYLSHSSKSPKDQKIHIAREKENVIIIENNICIKFMKRKNINLKSLVKFRK